MASLQSVVEQPGTEVPSLPAGTLAVLRIQIQSVDDFMEKVTVTAALQASWQIIQDNLSLALESIKLEVLYPDSIGLMISKNTGLDIQARNTKELSPMIWNESVSGRIFQTTFTGSTTREIGIRYHVQLKLTPLLPAALGKRFTEERKLSFPKNSNQTYLIKIQLV